MKDIPPAVLIEPLPENRDALVPALASCPSIRLAATGTSYDSLPELLAKTGAQLVFLGLDADLDRALDLVRILLSAHPEVAVLPLSRAREADTILRSIRAGAREFIGLPLVPDELLGAVDRLLAGRPAPVASTGAGPASPIKGQCTAIIGATGGVGCTTLAVNLASAAARTSGRDVVLADLDLLTGIVDVCLDLVPDQTLADLATNAPRLDPTLLKRCLSRYSTTSLYVLSAPRLLEQSLDLEPESIRRVLDLLVSQFPVTLLDLGKSLQTTDSLALDLADDILLVIQLEPACLRNSSRLLDLFRRYPGLAEKVRVVANRVGSSPFEITIRKAEELLGLPITWQLVNAGRLFDAARSKGQPIDVEAEGSKPHRAVLDIARCMFPQVMETEPPRSRLGRFAASFF